MAPQLVVANAPYKEYPAGVIALRAVDWVAGARGTLSTEADARAINGQVVRDTQQVTNVIRTNAVNAFKQADNTLEIDLSTVPIASSFPYRVFASILTEGDWDVTNSDTLAFSTNGKFEFTCQIGWSPNPAAAVFFSASALRPRDRSHYVIVEFENSNQLLTTTEIMQFRAYAQSGTSVEWLIDQIFLVPLVTSGTVSGWRSKDFAVVGVSGWGNDPAGDGTDGGDVNGKFTWHARTNETHTSLGDGGGDYQKDDSEYMQHLLANFDFFEFADTEPNPDAEGPGFAYSIHGSNYRPAENILTDTFTRTTGPNDWGRTTEGYGWWLSGGPFGTSSSAFTNGNQGVIETLVETVSASASLYPRFGGQSADQGARIDMPDLNFAGIVTPDSASAAGVGFKYWLRFMLSTVHFARSYFVHVDLDAKTWALYLANSFVYDQAINGTTDYKITTDFDISSWLTPASPVGFRVEKKRYLIRVRIWDATGAEPGTWDYEAFLPLSPNNTSVLGSVRTYSYLDSLAYAHSNYIQDSWFPSVQIGSINSSFWSSYWDDITVDYDPYGDPGPMSASLEDANGASKGSLEVPYGAWQFISWGRGDYSEIALGDPYLQFASKVWSDPAAAELQRAEALLYYFRIARGLPLVPMNWRSADRRAAAQRWLVGEKGP